MHFLFPSPTFHLKDELIACDLIRVCKNWIRQSEAPAASTMREGSKQPGEDR